MPLASTILAHPIPDSAVVFLLVPVFGIFGAIASVLYWAVPVARVPGARTGDNSREPFEGIALWIFLMICTFAGALVLEVLESTLPWLPTSYERRTIYSNLRWPLVFFLPITAGALFLRVLDRAVDKRRRGNPPER